MSETPDTSETDMHEADVRNGEPGATSWTETDGPEPERGSDHDPLDRDPEPGQLPSDTDVQAERQPE